jgi:hypothetical protein
VTREWDRLQHPSVLGVVLIYYRQRGTIASLSAHAKVKSYLLKDFHEMFHDIFVYESGLRRVQGTKNEILSPQRPTKGLETQIRSRSTARASKHRPRLTLDTPSAVLHEHLMFHDMFVH